MPVSTCHMTLLMRLLLMMMMCMEHAYIMHKCCLTIELILVCRGPSSTTDSSHGLCHGGSR
jgi:hypothetical protein